MAHAYPMTDEKNSDGLSVTVSHLLDALHKFFGGIQAERNAESPHP